jgi:hypothetical protein
MQYNGIKTVCYAIFSYTFLIKMAAVEQQKYIYTSMFL